MVLLQAVDCMEEGVLIFFLRGRKNEEKLGRRGKEFETCDL